jgi:hypothetical protein
VKTELVISKTRGKKRPKLGRVEQRSKEEVIISEGELELEREIKAERV